MSDREPLIDSFLGEMFRDKRPPDLSDEILQRAKDKGIDTNQVFSTQHAEAARASGPVTQKATDALLNSRGERAALAGEREASNKEPAGKVYNLFERVMWTIGSLSAAALAIAVIGPWNFFGQDSPESGGDLNTAEIRHSDDSRASELNTDQSGEASPLIRMERVEGSGVANSSSWLIPELSRTEVPFRSFGGDFSRNDGSVEVLRGLVFVRNAKELSFGGKRLKDPGAEVIVAESEYLDDRLESAVQELVERGIVSQKDSVKLKRAENWLGEDGFRYIVVKEQPSFKVAFEGVENSLRSITLSMSGFATFQLRTQYPLQNAFELFDTNSDGKLDQSEFPLFDSLTELLKSSGSEESTREITSALWSKSAAALFFASLPEDWDRTGMSQSQVCATELGRLLSSNAMETSQKAWKKHFEASDLSPQDEQLSLGELPFAAFLEMHDKNEDQQLSIQEWERVLKVKTLGMSTGSFSGIPLDFKDIGEVIFNVLDRNLDAQISSDEAGETLVSSLDSNGDGLVSKDEWQARSDALFSREGLGASEANSTVVRKLIFGVFDKDRSGTLDSQEFDKRTLAVLDSNRDGLLTPEEFFRKVKFRDFGASILPPAHREKYDQSDPDSSGDKPSQE